MRVKHASFALFVVAAIIVAAVLWPSCAHRLDSIADGQEMSS